MQEKPRGRNHSNIPIMTDRQYGQSNSKNGSYKKSLIEEKMLSYNTVCIPGKASVYLATDHICPKTDARQNSKKPEKQLTHSIYMPINLRLITNSKADKKYSSAKFLKILIITKRLQEYLPYCDFY